MIILKQSALFLFGISAGGVIAAGVFAFLAVIGVFPRLIAYVGERKHVLLCETMMILGGVSGTIIDLYHAPHLFGGTMFLAVWGIFTGIFVGSLVMSLAETLKALPVFARRVRMSVGIQYMILAMAIGKCAGSLIYFLYDFS